MTVTIFSGRLVVQGASPVTLTGAPVALTGATVTSSGAAPA
jgi:hypothetical protein